MRNDITIQARLIASLAETMTNNMWASDIHRRCEMIKQALDEIRREANDRMGGER